MNSSIFFKAGETYTLSTGERLIRANIIIDGKSKAIESIEEYDSASDKLSEYNRRAHDMTIDPSTLSRLKIDIRVLVYGGMQNGGFFSVNIGNEYGLIPGFYSLSYPISKKGERIQIPDFGAIGLLSVDLEKLVFKALASKKK